jgi:hypothetical protein
VKRRGTKPRRTKMQEINYLKGNDERIIMNRRRTQNEKQRKKRKKILKEI